MKYFQPLQSKIQKFMTYAKRMELGIGYRPWIEEVRSPGIETHPGRGILVELRPWLFRANANLMQSSTPQTMSSYGSCTNGGLSVCASPGGSPAVRTLNS